MTTKEALETMREALTFRSSDPDDTHDALAALDTLRTQLKRQEAALRYPAGIRDRCCGHGCMHDAARKALSTPPNQEDKG